MNLIAKGALAATGAAALMIGGLGSLAYWSDSETVTGTGITSGELKLGTPSCDGWLLNGAAFADQKIVPGDTLTRTCDVDLVATGENMQANLAIGTPGWSTANALTAQLTPTAVFTVGGATKTAVTEADDTGVEEIGVVITVDFPFAPATNASQALTSALDAITLSATQTDATP